jgi:D-xylose transport system ATP-binding protein
MSLLSVHNLSKKFFGIAALEALNLDIQAGEIHAICGENGAGKSTLMKILAGCYPAGSYDGEILLDGQPVQFKNPRQGEEAGIALIAQELALVPDLTLAENIYLGREPRQGWRLDRRVMVQGAREALAKVGLQADPQDLAGSLSVGKQQLLEIAKALSKQARVLILDEPTSALTDSDAERLMALVRGLASQGVACLYVSHRLEEVLGLCQRITVLRDGHLVETAPLKDWDLQKLVAAMVGRKVENLYPRSQTRTRKVLLEVKDWKVTPWVGSGKPAVDGLSFQLHEGEVLGLAGLMGAGRTALLSSLFGCAAAEVAGQMSVGEGKWKNPCVGPAQALENGICLVSEDRKKYGLVLETSLLENLSLATLAQVSKGGLLDWKAMRAQSEAQAKTLNIKMASLDAPANSLSGGNQQKVVLGKWFLSKPSILLLDEPTRGIDVGAKAEIYALINRWASEGMGVIMASSELPEVLGLSHRILVLSQGRQTALTDAEKTTAEKVMHAAVA